MCERKVKKDAPAAVVSRAAYVSRAPPTDASSPALSGWGRPAWSLHVNPLSTIFDFPQQARALAAGMITTVDRVQEPYRGRARFFQKLTFYMVPRPKLMFFM